MIQREEREQVAVFAVLDYLAEALDSEALRRVFHVPNGGARDARTGARLKRSGVKRGVPDIICPALSCNRRAAERGPLAIEMKAGRGRPTAEQEDWALALREMDWTVATCYSASHAVLAVLEHLDIRVDPLMLRNRVVLAGGSWPDTE